MKKLKFNENWKPITEWGEFNGNDFDKRFPIDRTFLVLFEPNEKLTKQRKTRIRFVKHPDCKIDEVRVYQTDMLLYLPGIEDEKKFKITGSKEKIMKIEKAEKKYGIKLI